MATTNGTIKRITDKGFGFIAASDGTEYFFHQSACVGTRFDELREGQRVTFTPGQGPKAHVPKESKPNRPLIRCVMFGSTPSSALP